MPLPIMLRRAGFVILGIVFVVGACLAVAGRGPWYDEFYSFYLVRPGVPLGELVPAWLRDNHPPLFYALAWLWARMLGAGAGVEALRTINLVILAATIALFMRMARRDAWFGGIVWYYAAALVATFPALDRVDQLRSYFLSLALTALVLPLLVLQLRLRQTYASGSVALGILLMLAFGVHLITTVIVAGLVAAVIGHLLLVRRWRDAGRLIVIAGLALIPFAATMAIQLPTIMANTRTFWIPSGLSGARWSVEMELVGIVTANRVVSLTAGAGFVALLIGVARRDPQSRSVAAECATLAAGLILALAVLVLAHMHRPLLITRYLVAIDPIVALILAMGAQWFTRRLPTRATLAIDAAILVASASAIYTNLGVTVHQWSWNGTSRAIAMIVRQCPTATVYPAMQWNASTLESAPRDNLQVVPFAYGYVAQHAGFALGPSGSHSLSRECPTVFWTEHAASGHPTATAVIRTLRADGYPITSGRMVRRDIGWILVAPPRP